MKLADTLARLPAECIRELSNHPLIRSLLQDDRTLEAALSGGDWARRWTKAADPLDRQLLLLLVRRYAGLAFGEEEAELLLRREADWTGAEIRVALSRLRRDGVLFAVRKAWGERLLYVPSDMAGVWQLVLRKLQVGTSSQVLELPGLAAVKEADEDEPLARLPLSLELLSMWGDISRRGFPLTAKGTPNKACVAKLAAGMALKEDKLAELSSWTHADSAVPANIAMVIDLGLNLGWLKREPGQVVTVQNAPAAWAELSLSSVDAELLDIVTERYAGQEAPLHWVAAALRGMRPYEWFAANEAFRQWPEQPEPDEREREALDRWSRLLVAFGWMERRSSPNDIFLLWRIDPLPRALKPVDQLLAGMNLPGEGAVYVQPDLEVIVPPEAGFGLRWRLEQIAERISLDVVSVYRLTRDSCMQAGEAGYTAASMADWLEHVSGAPLPEPAVRALEDWFGRIGKLSLSDAKLLRAQTRELADLIARDGLSSAWLQERLSDCVFAVKPEGIRELAKRLSELGYPPMEGHPAPTGDFASKGKSGAQAPVEAAAAKATASAAAGADAGWMRLKQLLALYEPDGSIPAREELFPGVESIPSAWLQKPRSYHQSTRRELIERAMNWRTGVRVKRGDRWLDFIPEAIVASGGGWKVEGRIRAPLPGESAKVEWSADSFGELMIELPDGAAGRPRTNH